ALTEITWNRGLTTMGSRRLARSPVMAATLTALTVAVVGVAFAAEASAPAPPWSYEGETGPEHWGDSPEYATCGTGKRQSPIDLRNADRAAAPAISTRYVAAALTELNNGHTIEVSSDR